MFYRLANEHKSNLKSRLLKLGVCLFVAGFSFGVKGVSAKAADFYISPNGNDNNLGTISSPFKSISKAQDAASSGDTVYMMGGVYKDFKIASEDSNYYYVNNITKSGILYRAYSSKDLPIFDFSNVKPTKRIAAFRIGPGVKNVTFLAMEITGVKDGNQKQSECIRVEGNATFNQVSCHDNNANGFYFVNHATGSCIKCDSYNNIGTNSQSIGNTDGFGAHADGVTFKDCRAWNCSDDGYDCLTSKGSNTFDGCWAFNMRAGGDSNGFKIGGYGTGRVPSTVPVHTVTNCLSANNAAHGFYANHQPGQSATWTYNTAYNNRGGNFDMLERVSITDSTDIPGTREVLHYNIAFGGTNFKDANLPLNNYTNNSWSKKGVTVSADDFESLDVSQLSKKRGANGVLPNVTFMHLKSNSDLKGMGCFR
ncbi:protein of unknown function [Clostridium sp. DSM 8431]|uniref:right-handed parallel beta-helix repeat-containing protein n=1 Tax=Clostridium sp. DSM 8431 TaxID=1761781 RepID=UPI0008ED13ED|nr:DUF4990 domain-containing protein [Clostridium sp. DSM 8431]SFU90060.1 protein of unknown function [Clostridium sp. DSM 8431]